MSKLFTSGACFLLLLHFSSAIQYDQVPLLPQFEDCSNYQGLDTCQSGAQIDYPPVYEARRGQTPLPSSEDYKSAAWQTYRHLQGYAHVEYLNAERSKARVQVRTWTSRNETRLKFRFGVNAPLLNQNEYEFSSGMQLPETGVVIEVLASELDAKLILEPINFVWQHAPILNDAHTERGQKGAIVELFGWPYKDVAAECETHLGKAGYLGVKIPPPQEHVLSDSYLQRGELNPWYFMYQPVSYRLQSRLGSREELRQMIATCRKHGVRVYADAVINHMTGSGNDVLFHRNQQGGSCVYWGPKNGSAQSPFFTHSWTFGVNENTKQRPTLEFPAVPYGPRDFHCERSLSDWGSAFSLNYGWLVGLADLNTQSERVQERLASYMTDLLGIGFSGFRVDAAKHIRPDDLAAIFGKLKRNMNGLPDDFITWLEVIIGGEKMLLACTDNPYSYYTYFNQAMYQQGLTLSDINKILIWSSDYPKEHPVCGQWILPPRRFVIQNDDHDQQNPGSSSRDMGDKGSILIKEKDVERHRQFEQQLFDRKDGDWRIRLILSSYTFMKSGAQGFPDGFSDCSRYVDYPPQTERCLSVPRAKAHRPDVCGYTLTGWPEGQYTRVHRDRQIIMAMRRWLGLSTDVSNTELGLPDHC